MFALQSNRSVPMGAITTYQVIDLFDRGLAVVRAWIAARHTRACLESLSDAQLADVGLKRGDIDAIAARLARHHA
ncbi:MAG: DUF1127 domain-containing protein [Rhodobacteraceae bacterium]|nr:DUF1127 domain-containing protein [Paracoccaceae bacterium]